MRNGARTGRGFWANRNVYPRTERPGRRPANHHPDVRLVIRNRAQVLGRELRLHLAAEDLGVAGAGARPDSRRCPTARREPAGAPVPDTASPGPD